MAKKKASAIKVEVRDCSKCNESIVIEDLLYCKLKVRDINFPTSMGIVSFKHECGYFRLKRETDVK